MEMRTSPNIIITGTPGVGKSSHCEMLAEKTNLKHLIINEIAEQRGCFDGRDEELGSWIVDEDKLIDAIESDLEAGGNIIDWHACDCFPDEFIDLIIVVRASTSILYDRLKARNYSEVKIQQNMDAEIFQELLEEAKRAFPVDIVQEVRSDDLQQLDENVDRIVTWVEAWKKDHS